MSQAPLRRPGRTAYGCFLPDLTRFAASRRAGPALGRTPTPKGGPKSVRVDPPRSQSLTLGM